MKSLAVLEYSPAIISEINLLFSLWLLVSLFIWMKGEKTPQYIPRCPMYFSFQQRESVYTTDNHLAEIQRAVHLWNDNQGTVDFVNPAPVSPVDELSNQTDDRCYLN